jgi:NAD(P)-dependent dehydrogenase (short-subunit alcohol dehydrogenase family)
MSPSVYLSANIIHVTLSIHPSNIVLLNRIESAAMGDPRVRNMDAFTPTAHTGITPILDPAANRLKRPFTVCVIGASGAIGAGVAKSYARAGCSGLILAGRDLEKLGAVSSALSESIAEPPEIHIQHCDIATAGSVRALAEFASSAFPSLDAVVLVSGVSGAVELRITDGSPEDGAWAHVFGTNALGTYHVAHYFVPLLLKSETKAFMVVGSIAACITKGIIANTKYCVSKFAQARIVESVAAQFTDEGLLAVSVHPGAVESDNAIANAPPQFLKCK